MGCYSVDFGDYRLAHYDGFQYFNYFEFHGKKYPIGSYVNFTKNGEYYILNGYGYGFKRGDFRLVDHFINDKGIENWKYIIGRSYETNIPVFKSTTKSPDEVLETVICMPVNTRQFVPGELQVQFKEPNYFPNDIEVDGVMCGWFVMVLVWLVALLFKDWWITLIIQIGAGWYFGTWRENKINEAICAQKFKK